MEINERQVQALWYDRALRPSSLRTLRGVPLAVIEPGEWNLEAGPDFRRAALRVGERLVTGDVEVHVRPVDWTLHAHARDPAYRQVVAHVTWYGGEAPADLPPACVSVCLGDFLRTQRDFAPGEIDVSAYPFAHKPLDPRPCERRFAGRLEDMLALLRTAGRTRIAAKARRVAARFLTTEPRQVFYEETLTALGYKYNAFPFRRVAERLPWRDLPEDPEAAGIALDCVAAMTVTEEKAWHAANVRPANRPRRRLKAAAALFGAGEEFQRRLFACDLSSTRGQRDAVAILCATRLIGGGRAGAIMANALVPYALARGHLKDVPEWLYPEDLSAPVRLMAHRLMGRDHNPALYRRNGLFIQGLLHLYREHCLTSRATCAGCAFYDG